MNANIEAELRRTDTKYSWELSYGGTTQFHFGDSPKQTLWYAIMDANDSRNDMIEEENLEDNSCWDLPEVCISRYIGGEYDEDGRFTNYEYDGDVDFFNTVEDGGMGFDSWDEVFEWAESLYNREEWDAQQIMVKKYIAYCNKLKEAKVGSYANA